MRQPPLPQPPQERGGLMYDHDKAVESARRDGLCVPRKPRRTPQPFQRLPEVRCEKTGKRIRTTDGHCQECVPWNQPRGDPQ